MKEVFKNFRAFTLAELISVIVVLGIVAAIIIPATIKRQSEIIKRTTIKKALAAYSTAVEKIIIEQGLRSTKELDNWAKGSGDCAPVRQYFKAIETANGGCRFRTADKLWWDMGTAGNNSSLTKTFVAFKSEDLDYSTRKVTLLNNSDAFCFSSSFDDNGSLRIYDLSYALNKCDRSQLMTSVKLHHFLNKTKNFDESIPKCGNGRTTSCYAATSTPGKYNIKNGNGVACYMIETERPVKNPDPLYANGSGVPVGDVYGNEWCFANEFGYSFCNSDYRLSTASYCDVSALTCDDNAWVTLLFSKKNPNPPANYNTVFNNLGINISGYGLKSEAYSYTCKINNVQDKSASSCSGEGNTSHSYTFRTGDNDGASAVTITIKPSGNRPYQYSTSIYSTDCTTHPGCYHSGANQMYCCDAEFKKCSANQSDSCS